MLLLVTACDYVVEAFLVVAIKTQLSMNTLEFERKRKKKKKKKGQYKLFKLCTKKEKRRRRKKDSRSCLNFCT